MFFYSKKKKKDNMKRVVFAILALSLLLGACEKELPGNKSSEVRVQVRMLGVAAGGEEDVTRSSVMKKPKRVTTPLGNSMLLEMEMEQGTSALRATSTQLAGDSYFRVVAFKHSTSTFISYGDFTIDGGLVGGSLHVPINDSYDFVCYSYNTTTSFSALSYAQDATVPVTETIPIFQNTKDLLYQKIENFPVGATDPELEILLNRVMTRVKLVVDFSYNGWTIDDIPGSITLESVGSGGTVQLASGTVEATGTPTFSSWSGSGSLWESNELLITPNATGATVNVPIDAIERENLASIPTKLASTKFSNELKPGFSYNLRMRFRVPIFARSNIYWDGNSSSGKLTFVKAKDTPPQDDSKKGYQGVLFKWGSLVGVSPAQVSSNNDYTNRITPIYVPIVNTTLSASTWKPTTSTGVKAAVGTAENWTTWSGDYSATDIPYMNKSLVTRDLDRNGTFLMDPERNDLLTYQGFRGDI
jgi:hypothetical protein